jgi:hypothetical protein
VHDIGETTFQIARGVALAATVLFALALERWRPHERLRPAWDRLGRTYRRGDGERHVVTGLPDWDRARSPSLSESLLLPVRRPAAPLNN